MNKKVLTNNFKSHFASGKYTKWATDLSDDTLRTLLWMIGEYGVRVWSYKEPVDTDEPDNLHLIEANKNVRATEALRIIAAIVHGEEISHSDAINRINASVERFKSVYKSPKMDYNRKVSLNTATKLSKNEISEFKQVSIDNQTYFLGLVKLLIEKGIITKEELIKQVIIS
jgi:hypothetical protein